ncbi:Hypothetical protein SRAE_2000027600 [Strongyloides ratti]|uniref:Uncharacterized protein n=1 Tax=Strongyloides ratti TaxID=34506 RepID=A0A090MXK6_STRRB|nr:Hypothetical protein SRAE_2000027600 [Strongyloides ratti]CEF65599.1 Hypothetical protein SRAE_2000027600 [Strongyloides ratti]
MDTCKSNQSNNKLLIFDKILKKFTLFLKRLPWKIIIEFAIPIIVIFSLSFCTNIFIPSLRIFQALSVRDSIQLLKYSVQPNDTCFINYNGFTKLKINNYSIIDYKKDVHVIILDGLQSNNKLLLKEYAKYGSVFSSYHTIGSSRNKRINNFLNGKLNNDCVEENDEFLLTNIFKKKGYQVKTFIDSNLTNGILCTNNNNYIDKIMNNFNKKPNYVSKDKPSFSLTILFESFVGSESIKMEKIIENILTYQGSSFNSSYIILISNNVMYYNPYLMISLPLEKKTNEYNSTLLYNNDKSLTSYDLYKTLVSNNDNNTSMNILTTLLPKRSCQEMKVPIENCRCQSNFFKLPKEMIKVKNVLNKHFVKDLKNYFESEKYSKKCIKKLNEMKDYIETYYAFITLKKGIHFKVVLKLNEKRMIMAFYNDNFSIASQGVINIGEDKNC